MSDNNSMSFTLNQAALNAAIAAELPRLIRELNFDYVSGRQPKGLTAQVTVNESMIRQSVLAYARRNVNAHYTHFDIAFKATRGEEGITTTVTASNSPREVEAPVCSMPTQAEAIIEAEEVIAVEVEPTADTDVFAEEAEADAVQSDDATSYVNNTVIAPASPPAARSKLFAGLKRPDNSVVVAAE